MKRLYFLTNNIESAAQISTDLHAEGISDWNFHVLCKDEAGLYKRHIHSANYWHKLDILRDAERGGLLGLIAALLMTAWVASREPFGADVSGLAYLAIFVFIALFGTWIGGMIGLTTENQKIAQYHKDIDAGRFLVMIDVKPGDEARVQQIMALKHPEAEFNRIGSTFINPFKFANHAV